jgi:hypothetical protein
MPEAARKDVAKACGGNAQEFPRDQQHVEQQVPSLHPRAVKSPDGTLTYTREDGEVIVLPNWEHLNSKNHRDELAAERQAQHTLFPVSPPILPPVPEAVRKWLEIRQLFPELTAPEDLTACDPHPPALEISVLRCLVGTLCRPEGEAVVAVQASFIREIVRDEMGKERRGG